MPWRRPRPEEPHRSEVGAKAKAPAPGSEPAESGTDTPPRRPETSPGSDPGPSAGSSVTAPVRPVAAGSAAPRRRRALARGRVRRRRPRRNPAEPHTLEGTGRALWHALGAPIAADDLATGLARPSSVLIGSGSSSDIAPVLAELDADRRDRRGAGVTGTLVADVSPAALVGAVGGPRAAGGTGAPGASARRRAVRRPARPRDRRAGHARCWRSRSAAARCRPRRPGGAGRDRARAGDAALRAARARAARDVGRPRRRGDLGAGAQGPCGRAPRLPRPGVACVRRRRPPRALGRLRPRARGARQDAGGRRRFSEVRPGFDRRWGKGACVVAADGTELDVHRTFVAGPFGLTVDLSPPRARPGAVRDRRSRGARARPLQPVPARLLPRRARRPGRAARDTARRRAARAHHRPRRRARDRAAHRRGGPTRSSRRAVRLAWSRLGLGAAPARGPGRTATGPTASRSGRSGPTPARRAATRPRSWPALPRSGACRRRPRTCAPSSCPMRSTSPTATAATRGRVQRALRALRFRSRCSDDLDRPEGGAAGAEDGRGRPARGAEVGAGVHDGARRGLGDHGRARCWPRGRSTCSASWSSCRC